MKNRILNIAAILTTLMIISYVVVGANYRRPASIQDGSIIGTWISNKDNNWKLVFATDGKCYNYYEGALTETSTYSISNTSPQCGETVPVDEYSNYIQLTNIQNGDKICYEINGISTTSLSLRVIDKGGALVFTRQ